MSWWNSLWEQVEYAWGYLTTGRVLATVLGVAFALLAIGLLIASRTKWGQAKPLTKCIVLSVLLHVWLLMYAIGHRKVLPQGSLDGQEQNIAVAFEDAQQPVTSPGLVTASPDLADVRAEEPAEESQPPAWEQPVATETLPKPPDLAGLDLSGSLPPPLLPPIEPTPMPKLPPPESLAAQQPSEPAQADTGAQDSSSTVDLPVQEMIASDQVGGAPVPAFEQPPTQPVVKTVSEPTVTRPDLPADVQLRFAPNRTQLAAAYGADADSEAAVEAALAWLAQAQSRDGSWNAKRFGAGTETYALGESRQGTGDKADTGVSGLALLAFLGAGHTHLEGKYQTNVLNGLRYLLSVQMPSGDLSGPKQVGNSINVVNARMYCHGIATLALAEAYSLTRDAALEPALLQAVQFTINAQDPRSGGWRYRAGDPGDLSQFGWQAMALKSVERGGIRIPSAVKQRMQRFLDSCAAGQFGGLATYRPRQGRPSATMTAEALACRLMLNYPLSAQGTNEAVAMLQRQQPGQIDDNVYYWYYATLALFQLQNDAWREWNRNMKVRLLETQLPAYEKEGGSWNPDGLWGGYGGRVYSTAMSCMCLEVYYRYLPMYQQRHLAEISTGPVAR